MRGLRPAGVGLGREADDLDEEESFMEDEKVGLISVQPHRDYLYSE